MRNTEATPLEPPARVLTVSHRTAFLALVLILVIGVSIGLKILTLQQIAEAMTQQTVQALLALFVIRTGGKL